MKLSSDQVQKVAKLANLNITDTQLDKFSGQLTAILEYIDQLEKVDTSGVEPLYNVTGNSNVFRQDIERQSLSQEEALQNASQKDKGYFVTKGVFEEE